MVGRYQRRSIRGVVSSLFIGRENTEGRSIDIQVMLRIEVERFRYFSKLRWRMGVAMAVRMVLGCK